MAAKTTESAATIAALHLKQPERAAEMYKKASDLYLANMSPDRAGEMLEKEPVNVDNAIELYMAACSLFEYEDRGRHAFVQSEESAIASALLDAFEQGDQDLLTQTVRKQTVIFLDNEIAKLARGLQVPGAISQLPTAQSNTSNNEDNYIIPYHVDEQRPLPPEPTEASTSTFAPNQTEIEDEDDIC
ncbi:17344_t:CDS:2 [Racocetra fulgida]|uniref:17344_t:CDS:1 n=1 Tax=Racocetra fulgida TaxID=60492 RepID=A0A9N9HZY5_9GLOM|nr:17344_t:CDS:2 [Racocetra fulgida]